MESDQHSLTTRRHCSASIRSVLTPAEKSLVLHPFSGRENRDRRGEGTHPGHTATEAWQRGSSTHCPGVSRPFCFWPRGEQAGVGGITVVRAAALWAATHWGASAAAGQSASHESEGRQVLLTGDHGGAG